MSNLLVRGLDASKLIRNRAGKLILMPSPRPFAQGEAGAAALINSNLNLSNQSDNSFTISAAPRSLSISYNGSAAYPGASQGVRARFKFYRPRGSAGTLTASITGTFDPGDDPIAGFSITFSNPSAIDLPASTPFSSFLSGASYASVPSTYSGRLPFYRLSLDISLILSLRPGASLTASFSVT